jgi:hypothetical protein
MFPEDLLALRFASVLVLLIASIGVGFSPLLYQAAGAQDLDFLLALAKVAVFPEQAVLQRLVLDVARVSLDGSVQRVLLTQATSSWSHASRHDQNCGTKKHMAE